MMTVKLVTEPGVYGGKFRKAGQSYDDAWDNPPDAPGEPSKGADDDLDAMTKPELEAIAKERGVDIAQAQAKTKAEIVEALRKA